jgi:hypothetical protein
MGCRNCARSERISGVEGIRSLEGHFSKSARSGAPGRIRSEKRNPKISPRSNPKINPQTNPKSKGGGLSLKARPGRGALPPFGPPTVRRPEEGDTVLEWRA